MEIRDPIHVFIQLDDNERTILNSEPLQRLRHIHQLAMTYLVYPGATHTRLEHSLGVMELSGRVFDVLTSSRKMDSRIVDLNFIPHEEDEKNYWRRVLRMAALCHDIGHLPFSHAGESLLPKGYSHETLTAELILSPEMQRFWKAMKSPLEAWDIVKLALKPKEYYALKLDSKPDYSTWEAILSEIITGDVFGVDRMDYLLRDSYHAGVTYGQIDHHRIIDSLRILPKCEDSDEPELGIDYSGLHCAEAMQIARYFCYVQIYFHHVRKIYDKHLQEFLKEWLEGGCYSTTLEKHLQCTDHEVTSAILQAARNPDLAGHEPASRIVHRSHFRLLSQRTAEDTIQDFNELESELKKEFDERNCRRVQVLPKVSKYDFPVLSVNKVIKSSLACSEILSVLTAPSVDFLYVNPEIKKDAQKWLKKRQP